MKGLAAAALAAAFAVCVALPGAAAPVRLQHVTLIGDSVADAIAQTNSAIEIVRQGVNLDFEVAPCRRVEGTGCPYQGTTPASAVQVIQSMGSKIGPYVVMAVGYNDFEDQYAGNVSDALAALKAAGVKRVFWLTLRAAHHPYLTMNADIAAAAQQHPELTVVDWNVYSRSHPTWFQSDGLHLVEAGADGMATLIHSALLAAGVAAAPVHVATTALPVAHRSKSYHAKLAPAGGLPPFHWSLLERAPAGIHLEANGAIIGTPRAKPGRYPFNVKVEDALHTFAIRRLTIRIA